MWVEGKWFVEWGEEAAVSTAQARGKAEHWRQSTGQLWNKVGTPILMIQDEKKISIWLYG